MNNSLKNFVKDIPILTLGMFIGACSVHFFLIPSGIVIGSITGLSMVLSKLTGFSVPGIMFVVNMILLILSYILIGPEFGVKTVYSALIISPLLSLLQKIYPIRKSFMGDTWFDLLGFVLVLSLSQTIMFRNNASTGGLDIIAKIVNKFLHIDLGTSVTVAGAMICMTALAINPVPKVLVGIIGTYLNGVVLDNFMVGFNSRKKVNVISEDYEKIRQFIVKDMDRGATLYPVKGGYEGKERYEIESLMTKTEFSYLLEYIKMEDIKVFITAGTVSEIYGDLGHKNIKGRPAALRKAGK